MKTTAEMLEDVEFDPDDEELDQTPPDVVMELGFDPLEEEAEAAHEFANDAAREAAKQRALTVEVRLVEAARESVRRVVEAAVVAEAAEADHQTGKRMAAAEVRTGWQWLTAGDERVCGHCKVYEGARWDADFAPLDDGPEYPGDPPLHFGCRCSATPVDLGAPPAPELTFDEYLDQFSASEKERVFGRSAMRAYVRGDMTAAQLVGQRENILTLEQFKRGGPP